jgi:phage shock protein PspC (stress-responsive transcriptional regulator)
LVHVIEQIGSFAGLAAFLGLAILALLSFAHGRDIRRLRDWAGSAPERDAERKEVTSTIAAQRAEELRALEESRTAEHEALAERETRRQRRDEGLPELTRGERFRGLFAGFGERLSSPLMLVALFVVFVLVVGGVAYAVLNNGSDSSGKNAGAKTAKQSKSKVKPDEIEVAVLNGTAVSGLAATYGDKVQGEGFELGPITNTASAFESSIVMFKAGHKPEAQQVAKQLQITKLEKMDSEIESVSAGANVAVIVGEDNAAAAG